MIDFRITYDTGMNASMHSIDIYDEIKNEIIRHKAACLNKT